jgi:hypothetical protein
MYEGCGTTDWRRFTPSWYGAAGDIFFTMYPDRAGDRDAVEAFWGKVVGHLHPPEYLVYDFVEGPWTPGPRPTRWPDRPEPRR